MDTFRFAPELFEHRNDVIAALAEAGFDWLSHYSSVDPLTTFTGSKCAAFTSERTRSKSCGS